MPRSPLYNLIEAWLQSGASNFLIAHYVILMYGQSGESVNSESLPLTGWACPCHGRQLTLPFCVAQLYASSSGFAQQKNDCLYLYFLACLRLHYLYTCTY
jgi:hypothetical protein